MVSIKRMQVQDAHKVLYEDIRALMTKHADKLTKIEVLAVAANMVGKLIAMQDQRDYTPDQVMQMVAMNIELGNREAMEQLLGTGGTRQ